MTIEAGNEDAERGAASVNVIMATWTVGKDVDPRALIDKLRMAPYSVTVVVFTTAVAERSTIRRLFDQAVWPDDENCASRAGALERENG